LLADTVSMSAKIRRIIIDRSHPVRVGHIGSSLSIADLLAVIYGSVLRRGDASDRFVLSKGHAALALYAVLYCVGELSEAELESYCLDGSSFGEHPDHVTPGIEFSTGSLGMGLSYATGLALGAKLRASDQRTVVLMSDAELNEGATWEAAMFAAHHQLSNLLLVLDLNGQQALGRTSDVLHLEELEKRWEAFGWDSVVVDGHDHAALTQCVDALNWEDGPPHVLLAQTVFGRGVGFMERQLGWHYWSMSDEQYASARQALEAR